MKKIIIPFLIGLMLFVSCKKEVVKTPEHLIEKDKMVDIMYDLSILAAMRSQNPILLDSFKGTPNEYIYKKYKIDSVQFVQSNIYYAADFKEYEKMYEQVKLRLEKDKKITEAVVEKDKNKVGSSENKSQRPESKSETDSISKAELEETGRTNFIKKHKRKRILSRM